jgi:cell division protein FtsB
METIGRSLKYIVIVAGLVFFAFLVISFNSRIAEQRELVAQAEIVEAKRDALRLTDANLDAQIAYATSDAAVEKWAYEEARWVRAGDQPMVPISPSESTPIAPPLEMPEPVVYENWQVWWALFFDDELQ